MFKKQECNKCGKKVNEQYEFCPHCGNLIKGNFKEGDWGLLGKEDSFDEINKFSESIFGGVGGKVVNKFLGSAIKMLENEMQKEIKKERREPMNKTNFQLFVNGKKINLGNTPQIQMQETKTPVKKISLKQFSSEKLKRLAKLPKKEPSTKIRRFADKVVYEISIPGIKSINDISITKLETSIEIKAIGKNKAYSKLIPINLPLIGFNLLDEKLVLEFSVKS
jgi:HSP20 family molecular chaperone IbpA